MRFLALLSIFLAGFTLHICAIYQPVYENPTYWNGTIPPLGQEFIVPYKSFEMLFYALFGLVEPDNMPPLHLNPAFSKLIIKLVFGNLNSLNQIEIKFYFYFYFYFFPKRCLHDCNINCFN